MKIIIKLSHRSFTLLGKLDLDSYKLAYTAILESHGIFPKSITSINTRNKSLDRIFNVEIEYTIE